jgi:hypothetical protein
MRAPIAALVCLLSACGGGPSTVPTAQDQALCAGLLDQVGGEFGCRAQELSAGDHSQLESEHAFQVDVHFRDKGTVERYSGLRPVDRKGGEAPECLVGRLLALKVQPGAARTLPLRIRYVPDLPQGAYASALPGGACALTLSAP